MSAAPLTFAGAAERNPFRLLLDLYDQTQRCASDTSAAGALTELALSAAVVSWWARWQPLTMHKALLGGATLTDIAAATGLTEDEVNKRWSDWADVQCALNIGGHPALDPATVADIRTRLLPAATELP
jgi:hypothetical protein